MADLSPAQKLAQLRQRWERDPKSRVFLQLAEEYRRAGRLAEAVRVLESGLAAHPGYVAAQVVLGRCLLETGDSARAVNVLERAIASDPTQIVANRLLVDAYLGIENVSKARERLDLYRLLNDRDADIEALEARIAALGGEMRPATVRSRPPRERSGEFAPPAAEVGGETYVLQSPTAVTFPPSGEVATPAEGVVRPRSEQPFGRIRGQADLRRIVTSISAAGIFPVAPLRFPAPPARPAKPLVAAEQPTSTQFAPFSVEDLEPVVAAAPEPQPVGASEPRRIAEVFAPPEPTSVPETPAPAVAEIPSATATLGALYLAQGHLADAAESFEAVLDRNPEDMEALEGLAEVRRRRSAEAAAFSEETADEASAATPVVGGMTARKIERLRQFMASMRRGADAHVS